MLSNSLHCSSPNRGIPICRGSTESMREHQILTLRGQRQGHQQACTSWHDATSTGLAMIAYNDSEREQFSERQEM